MERVEEYRYISSSAGEFRDLPFGVAMLRLRTFQKVNKRMTAPTNGKTAGVPPKLGKRLR